MNKSVQDIEQELIQQYHEIHPHLIKWATEVDKTLINMIAKNFQPLVKIFPQFRLKTDRSYLNKALYRNQEINNPLIDIWDKVATRIVLLKSDDVKTIADAIQDHPKWKAEITKTIKQEIQDKPKIFDYQSLHVVVWPTNEYEPDDTLRRSLSCEIQIRTLLQHAFAEVSHDSVYKGLYKNDREIIRHLSKSMALMEVTDDYFVDLFNMMQEETRITTNLLNELTIQFLHFAPDFNRQSDVDYELTDSLLALYNEKEFDINQLPAFLKTYHKRLQEAIIPRNGLLFQQPIVLLVAYYLFKHPRKLRDKWPLNKAQLQHVFHSFGIAFS